MTETKNFQLRNKAEASYGIHNEDKKETFQRVGIVPVQETDPETGDPLPEKTASAIANDAEDITPSDTITFDAIGFKSIEDGTIKVDTKAGETRIITVFEGLLEPVKITRFYATDSTVSSIRIYKS